jgi:hypothetical protein
MCLRNDDTPYFPLTSKVRVCMTIEGMEPTRRTQTEVENLQGDNHLTTIYFMMIMLYEDRSGTHAHSRTESTSRGSS